MEIERKWLVDPAKTHFLLTNCERSARIEQFYVNGKKDEWTIRFRKYEDRFDARYVLDLKSEGLLSREELTFGISYDDFVKGSSLGKKKIVKTRYYFPYGKHTFEIDVYDDYDFVTAEIEFESETEANAFEAPSWCIQDVTMNPKYKNVNLAK
jgi:CYTH domain-containing protein